MSAKLLRFFILGIFLLTFQIIANAQSVENKDRNIIVVGAAKTLKVGGKITYIVVKETAKIGWEATKVTAGELVAPAANAIIVKAAPKVSIFLIKRGTPIAAKLLLTYIKL